TQNGRTVLDGGGVTPDIQLEATEDIPFIKALIESNLIFHYVTDYLMENPIIENPREYKFPDFSGFKKYVESKKEIIKLPIEKSLDQLKEEALTTQFSGDLTRQIAALQKAIDKEKDTSLDK